MKKLLTIEGMTCGSCVAHITKALEGNEGVISVNVDLGSKTATVESDIELNDETLKKAVAEAGYTVTGISEG